MLFSATIPNGYLIKNLIDILFQNFQDDGCLQINLEGIFLSQICSNMQKMVNLEIKSENITDYIFNGDPLTIGINWAAFLKNLKRIKMKDKLTISIHEEKTLNIEISSEGSDRKTISTINIHHIQRTEVEPITGYISRPIVINSRDFNNMCKELRSDHNFIEIQSAGANHICFTGENNGITQKKIIIGKEDPKCLEPYFDRFQIDHITKLSKLNGISEIIKIFHGKNLPIMFQSNIGNLGTLSITIRAKKDETI